MLALGRCVYGLGIMAVAMLGLAWDTFDVGQPVPDTFPGRAALAYLAAIIMLVGGAAVLWRRTVVRGAAALFAYYTLIVIVVMNGPVLLAHYAEYGTYESLAEQIAFAAAALMIYATYGALDAALSARLVRVGQIAFGVSALIYGGAHFAYMNLTAPLVPRWLPPSQVFWGQATGVAQIAAGLAFLSGVQARLAGMLLTVMYVLFQVMVHIPVAVHQARRSLRHDRELPPTSP